MKLIPPVLLNPKLSLSEEGLLPPQVRRSGLTPLAVGEKNGIICA
jgi:hypothetical protein